MNRWMVAVIGAVVGVGMLAGVVGTSQAADPTPTPPARTWRGGGAAGGYGFGFGYQTMTEALTKLLGMTAQEIHDARLSGKSLVQIAQSKGETEADVISALLTVRKKALDEKVQAGTITQAQADAAYKLMQERIKAAVNRTEIGPNRPADGQRLGLGPGAGAGLGPGAGSGPRQGFGGGPRGRWGGPAR